MSGLAKYENQILNMDCLDFFKQCPDNSIDLVVTDCPYKIVQGGCTNKAVKLKGAKNESLKSGKIFNNNTIKFSEWLPPLYKVLKEGSHCYIMINDRNLKDLIVEAEKAGFKLLNILIWKKTKHTPNRYYLKNAEFIVFLRKGHAKNIRNMGTFTVIEVPNVDNKIHPSEKPVDLLKILIENSSDENDIVLDPFSGSGGAAVACRELKRKFICIEKDLEYYTSSKQRLEVKV